MRNLLALASGVRRTICWNLAPEVPGYENHLSVMDLLFGKLALLDDEGAELSVRRRARDPLLVVWDHRDSFSGEDDPPVPFDWPWPTSRAAAVDAFGQPQPVEVLDGRLRLRVSDTPLFVTAG